MKKPHVHKWRYVGGYSRCDGCGKYVQPDGRITSTPSGRKRPRKRSK